MNELMVLLGNYETWEGSNNLDYEYESYEYRIFNIHRFKFF